MGGILLEIGKRTGERAIIEKAEEILSDIAATLDLAEARRLRAVSELGGAKYRTSNSARRAA